MGIGRKSEVIFVIFYINARLLVIARAWQYIDFVIPVFYNFHFCFAIVSRFNGAAISIILSLRAKRGRTKQSIIDNNTIVMKIIIFSLLWFWIAALTSLVHNDGNEQLI
jgi:hypothetical protein